MTLIVDANVIGKLFLDEDDYPVARAFVGAIAERRTKLFAPTILSTEVFGIAIHNGLEFDIPARVLQQLEAATLHLIEPNMTLWQRAYAIAQTGHPKSGYPSLQDSLYHALAIETGGTFITADKRHLAKTKNLGHAVHLHDWADIMGMA